MFQRIYTNLRTKLGQRTKSSEKNLNNEFDLLKEHVIKANNEISAFISKNIKNQDDLTFNKLNEIDLRIIELSNNLIRKNEETNGIMYQKMMNVVEELIQIKSVEIDIRLEKVELDRRTIETNIEIFQDKVLLENEKTYEKFEATESKVKEYMDSIEHYNNLKNDKNYEHINEKITAFETKIKEYMDSREYYNNLKNDEKIESIKQFVKDNTGTNSALFHNNIMLHSKIGSIEEELNKKCDGSIVSNKQYVDDKIKTNGESHLIKMGLIEKQTRTEMDVLYNKILVDVKKMTNDKLKNESTIHNKIVNELTIKIDKLEKIIVRQDSELQLSNQKYCQLEEQIQIMTLLTNDTHKFIKSTTAKILYRILDIEGNVNVFSQGKQVGNSFIVSFKQPEPNSIVKDIFYAIACLTHCGNTDYFLNVADNIIWDRSYSHDLIYIKSNLDDDVQKSISMIKSSHWLGDDEYRDELKILESYDNIKTHFGKLVSGRQKNNDKL